MRLGRNRPITADDWQTLAGYALALFNLALWTHLIGALLQGLQ